MRILVVDDDKITLELLRNTLSEAGYEVDVAHDGQEALDILREGSCRLVVSDLMMPRLDGLELCEALRSGEFDQYVYIIILTSCDRSTDVINSLSGGADDFLTKPFIPEELCLRVRTGERILSMETRDATIFALAKLAESRDPETGAHLERICYYSRIIAQHLRDHEKHAQEIDASYVRHIFMTSALHDIGKVGIPDSILLKPGCLSDREFEIMKSHTVIGAESLEAAMEKAPEARFLRMARDIALTHHERFDGSGYPRGLTGDDIPLCGRIVALADVYDALMSRRCYKDAFTHEVARGIILEEVGSHFDPDMVEAFTRSEELFILTHERFKESAAVESAGRTKLSR